LDVPGYGGCVSYRSSSEKVKLFLHSSKRASLFSRELVYEGLQDRLELAEGEICGEGEDGFVVVEVGESEIVSLR